MANYPKYVWDKQKQRGRRHPQCRNCKRVPGDGETYYKLTIQYSYMRGEDDVKYYCVECKDKAAANTGSICPVCGIVDQSVERRTTNPAKPNDSNFWFFCCQECLNRKEEQYGNSVRSGA